MAGTSSVSPAAMRSAIARLAARNSMQVHNGAGQQIRAAGIVDADLAHHLADDDLDVLIVDVNALLTVDLLDLLNQIVLPAGIDAADAQHVMRAVRAAR